MKSSSSEMSSPSLRIADPQSGQVQLDGACTMVSRGRCAGKARGTRRERVAELLGGVWVESSSGSSFLVEGLWIGGQLQIIERELQLHECRVHALGGATEAPALESRDLGQQLGDGLVAPEDKTLECFDIIG